MKLWKRTPLAFVILVAAVLLLPDTAWSQANGGIVGFWTGTSGSITHEYAFANNGKFESKVYGSLVYHVDYGTYTVQGDQLTMKSPQTSPETCRWKIVNEYGKPTLKLTDSFGATVQFFPDRWDQRYSAGPLIPYDKASLTGYWIVNHGHMHWEYAFTADGKFQSKRVGNAINETVRGTYTVKGNILILASPDKPLQGFGWRIELENGARSLILVDPYGIFEVYYESKAGA